MAQLGDFHWSLPCGNNQTEAGAGVLPPWEGSDTVVPGLCLWLSMASPYVSSLGGGGMAQGFRWKLAHLF